MAVVLWMKKMLKIQKKLLVDIRKADFQQCEITLGNRLLNLYK